jgi:FSR family fosmidomycin resistance protein-like MFS transporter
LKTFRRDLVGGRVQAGEHHEAWRPFVLLAGVIAVRSFVYFGLVTFIPLYYIHDLHSSKALGNAALTAMLLGGAVGTLTGGPLADRVGRRTVLIGSMCIIPPLVVGFLLSGPVLALVFAALAGAVTIATFAVTIVMGQEYLPGRLGISAGVTIGLSIGLGGVGAPLLGVLGDAAGLRAVFETVAVLPLAALALTLALPRQTPRESVGAPAARATGRPARAGSPSATT